MVEDDFFLAEEMAQAIHHAEGRVLGPCSNVVSAMTFANANEAPDAAILDFNLLDETTTEVAGALMARGVRVLMLTGQGRHRLPEALAAVPVLEKPMEPSTVLRFLRDRLRAES